MESNADVSVGQVWSAASWAIVLGARGLGRGQEEFPLLMERYAREHPGTFLPHQFESAANVAAHRDGTGPELLAQLERLGLRPTAIPAGIEDNSKLSSQFRTSQDHLPKEGDGFVASLALSQQTPQQCVNFLLTELELDRTPKMSFRLILHRIPFGLGLPGRSVQKILSHPQVSPTMRLCRSRFRVQRGH